MKIGIIGYGNIGKVYEEVLRQMGIHTCICDLRSEKYIQSYKANSLKNCDAIIVSTPPSTHLEIAKYFAKLNIPVLIEKPAVIKEYEYIELSSLIENGKSIFLAYHTRFNPGVLAIEEFIRNRKIKSVSVTYQENVLDYHDRNSWVFDSNISGGGCVIDSGINILSVLHVFFREIIFDEITLSSEKYPRVEFKAKMQALADKKVNVLISIDWEKAKEKRLYKFIDIDNNELVVNLATGELTIDNKHISLPKGIKVNHQAEYSNLVRNFLNNLQEPNASAKEDLKSLKNIFSIYKHKK